MEAVIALLVVLLVVLAGMLIQLRRERRAALALLGGDADPLPAARAAGVRARIDRVELAEALALRDALMDGARRCRSCCSTPGARLVRWNGAAREALPRPAARARRRAGGARDGRPRRPRRPAAAALRADGVRAGAPALPRAPAGYPEPGHAALRGRARADESDEADYRDARSLFSAGVSHELRTPLARMLALVDTLSLPLRQPEREEMMDGCATRSTRMRRADRGDGAAGAAGERRAAPPAASSADVTDAVADAASTRHGDAALAAGRS